MALSMDSSSCVSHPHDHENNRDEGTRDTSPPVEVAARVFFPLTPDLTMKEVGNSRQEGSITSAEAIVVEEEAGCNRTQKEKKDFPGCDAEEDRRNGISTELVLRYDPYKIKKQLTQSDLGNLSRLLIGRELVKSHLLRWMSEETVRRVESGDGAEVIVNDDDTSSEHRLMFVYWVSSRSFVLKGGWIKEFVKRRGLMAGDEVGLYWDPIDSKLHFRLLRMAD